MNRKLTTPVTTSTAKPEAEVISSRRDLFKLGALVGASSLLDACAAFENGDMSNGAPGGAMDMASSSVKSRGWEDYPSILARIKAPVFPARDFPISQFGAMADTDATDAIAKAITACNAAGGGRVVVPAGIFLTGPIVLKSNVNLHLLEGATLKFSTDPAKYPTVFTRWEGIECFNYAPLISAFEQENIAITGKGTLDGQASDKNWWGWSKTQRDDQKALIAMGDQGVPVAQRVFGAGHLLRPNFVQPQRCRNVLIEDISIKDSPMWELHPLLSTNVTIRGVKINSHGPNNDGCDPESCHDVLIEDCEFNTGDDCIAIKSGKNNDGRRVNVPSENIIVRNCRMKDGHGGVVLGSECSGHIRNVFVENCNMDSPHLDRVLRFKNNAVRGGILENVFARNITVGRVAEAIVTIDFLYEEGAKGPYKPVVRNVQLENVTSAASPRVMYAVAFPGAVIDQIKFSNCIFRGIESTEVMDTSGSVEFHNVVIEPLNKPASLSTRQAL
ncbi:MAG TPA: glycoside hydrolase family 28 protein [Rhodocyclaceae bacterium]|nr:glycoside hydrolase family 28 protein [Rhodocyclaceae bacterium]